MKATIIETTGRKVVRHPYKRTIVDNWKDKADFLLQAIDGNWYSLYSPKSIELKESARVKKYSDNTYAVTESVYKKISEQYTIEMDF